MEFSGSVRRKPVRAPDEPSPLQRRVRRGLLYACKSVLALARTSLTTSIGASQMNAAFLARQSRLLS
jgi:hypothetical protein